LSNDLLRNVGQFFYGAEWQGPLARDLGVNDRSLRRWVAGKEEIPRGVWSDLSARLGKYQNGLGLLARAVNQVAQVSATPVPSVTQQIEAAFEIARAKHGGAQQAWIDLGWKLAGRAALVPMGVNLQRAGDLDLALRSMEDEFAAAQQNQHSGPMAFHYQMMLSETWVIICYEALRALKQREREAADAARAQQSEPAPDDISALPNFRQIFTDFELLRMPMVKYEIAKDDKLKSPLTMRAVPPNGSGTDDRVYDKDDPTRSHIMPTGLSDRRSVMWLVLDHSGPREYWVERRGLSDRLLALTNEIEGAGLREARLAAEAASAQPVAPS
jgi:hypothetical protein